MIRCASNVAANASASRASCSACSGSPVASDEFGQRARRFMPWQIDSPRSKRVTNTAARPFDWCFSRNDINRFLAGSPREPDELTA